MNEFEKEITHRLQNEQIPGPRSEVMWYRIQEQQNDKKGRNNVTRIVTIRKLIVAASLLMALTAVSGVYKNEIVHAASSLFREVFGSIEQVNKWDPHADNQVMDKVEQQLQAAKSVLTKDEFQKYTALIQEQTQLYQKAIEIQDGQQNIYMDRLSPQERTSLKQIADQLEPLEKKIDANFKYTTENAAKMLSFPVKHPAYVPTGYTLTKEEAKSEKTSGAPQPVISFSYSKGEFGFRVRLSNILTGEADEYSLWKFDKEEIYSLSGNQVKYGKIGKNVTAMKMIVPEQGTRPSYQIFIIADVLSKQDVEKIAISLLENEK
jgi:bla regulator protein blaR1